MKTAVLKFGGDVVADRQRLAEVLAVVAARVEQGWRFLLCHGGGPQISALTRRLGMEPHKVGGRRVTDDGTLQVVKQVLSGEVNVDVVAACLSAGLNGVGFSGVSARTVDARKRPPMVVSGGGPDPVDFGHVGSIDGIRTGLIEHLWSGGYVPVLSTLGVGDAGAVFNINADTVSSAAAEALNADHLFLMTSVPGVLADINDPSSRLSRLTAAEVKTAIAQRVIVGGMIPKVEEAVGRLRTSEDDVGVGAVHILGADGAALAAEIESPGSVGTVLVP